MLLTEVVGCGYIILKFRCDRRGQIRRETQKPNLATFSHPDFRSDLNGSTSNGMSIGGFGGAFFKIITYKTTSVDTH